MADRDSRIRVILEGVDDLSTPIRNAVKSYRNARQELKALTRDIRVEQNSLGSSFRNAKGQFTILDEKDVKIVRENFKKIRTEFQKGFAFASTFGDEVNKSLADFDRFQKEKIAELRKGQDEERKTVREGILKNRLERQDEIDDIRAEIRDINRAKKEAADEAEVEELEREKDFQKKRIQIIRAGLAETSRIAQEELTRKFQAERAALSSRTRTEFLTEAFAERNQTVRQDIDSERDPFRRAGRKIGLAFGDIVKGARVAKIGIKELTETVQNSGTRFQKFGLIVGTVVHQIESLVNLRWLFITGIITIFFAVVVRLGAALVALASSAIIAAGALGGAFLAAVSQALPAVGLLAAAANRLNAVFDAVKLADKNRLRDDRDAKDAADKRQQAIQRLADAHYSLKKALESVADSEYELKRAGDDLQEAYKERAKAVLRLAEARKQAQKDIIDANLEERDASLSLAEAELAVLDAKERLRKEQERRTGQNADIEGARLALKEAQDRLALAKQQGDQAEISGATQQVAIAKQNLNAISDQAAEVGDTLKEAEIAVKRAEINREQAAIRSKRAREDAREKRVRGVEGSDVVVSAKEDLENATKGIENAQRALVLSNRQVRDSLRGVTVARRELADANKQLADKSNFLTSQQQQLNEALADFSPSERKVFEATKRLREAYKNIFSGTTKKDGILGPINEAIAEGISNLIKLLQDPEIKKNLGELAQTIGDSIKKISRFTLTPEFKDLLNFFIKESAKNLPKITEAFLNLFKVLLRLAKAGAPLFEHLLDRFLGMTDAMEKGSRNSKKLDKFFEKAGEHLDSWIDFGKAVGNVILALAGGAAPSGKSFLDDITKNLNEFATFLRENPEKVDEFFSNLIESLENLSNVFAKFLPKFVEAFASDNFTAFTELILEVVVPGLLLMIKFLGLASKALSTLFKVPIIGDAAKIAIQVAVAEKALNKLFPVSQKLTEALRKLATKGFLFLFNVVRNPGALIASVKAFIDLAKAEGIIGALSAQFPKLAAGITAAGKALRFLFLSTPPWVLIIAAIVGAIILLDRKFHFIRPTIEFLGKVFRRVFGWIKDNWKLLVKIILAPFTIVYYSLTKWRDDIIGVFKRIINWVKDHWRDIVKALTNPFYLGGLIIRVILAFKTKIVEIFTNIGKSIKNIFDKAIGYIKEKIGDLTGWVGRQLKKIPGFDRIFGGGDNKKSSKIPNDVANKILADESLDPIRTKIKNLRKTGKTSGEVLKALFESGDISFSDLSDLFDKYGQKKAFGGEIYGGKRGTDSVPAMLTPGEWVLNTAQQKKIATRVGMSVAQTKAFIFGTNMGAGSPGPRTTGTTQGKRTPLYYDSGVTLVPQEDPNGITVWFLQMADGTFGQVTGRDAKKIQDSRGNYIPNYVKRNTHGFIRRNASFAGKIRPGQYSMGGVVGSPIVQKFAEGGIVQNPGFSGGQGGVNVNQNFDIKTQGETDWNYVFRLGAMTAQGSF